MTLGSHQQTIGKSQVHITPKWIIDALGPFDLDPCAEYPCAYYCADLIYTEKENGLTAPWNGFVWCNPPFDRRVVGVWTKRMAEHNNGILLVHARIETLWFRPAWEKAAAIFFFDKRLNFCQANGEPHSKDSGLPGNSGAPVALVGFGALAAGRLENSKLKGVLLRAGGWENRFPS
jgi:hypothetical protein